jgi:hypothetical protein
MGGETNSLRSDKFPLFFHFSHRITGWLQAERPNWLAAHRQGTEMERRSQFSTTNKTKDENHDAAGEPPKAMRSEPRKNSAYESPLVTCSNRIKKGNLSERSEFVSLPDLSAAPTGTPKGRRIAVAFLCLLSLAKQRK